MRAYSAILADRFAVSASHGLATVVAEIKIAANVSERKDELVRQDSAKRVKVLVETLTERKQAERLIYSEEGAQAVSKKFDELCSEIQRIIESDVGTSDVIKFGFSTPMRHVFYANTRFGMHLGLALRQFYENSVSDTLLDLKIFKRQFGAFGEPHGDGQTIEERTLKPSFHHGEVVWILDDEDKRALRTEALAQHLVDTFIESVSEQAGMQSR